MTKSESKYFNTASKMNLALITLLKKKSFEYITVSEICKTAGVNRSTFYLHYETIGDLLDETSRYLLRDFLSYFSSDIQSIALNLTHCKLEELIFICDKYLIPYLKYIRDHKDIFKTALLHNKTLGFEDVYKWMFKKVFNPILERFSYPENNRRYVMCYYLNGINAIVTEWLNDNCSMSIEEVCEIITICIFGLQKQLIKNEQYQKEM